MEGEERDKEARVQVRPEIHFVPGLPQEQSIVHNMQYNHQPDSDRFCDSTALSDFTLF